MSIFLKIDKLLNEYKNTSSLATKDSQNKDFKSVSINKSKVRDLKIPDIEILPLENNYVKIKNLTNKLCDNNDKCVSKNYKLKGFVIDKKNKKEFIDEHDLQLYYDEEIRKIKFNAEVYHGGGSLGSVNIFFIAVVFNKRSLTHQVSKTGLVIISTPTNNCNEKIKKWDHVQVTGRIRSADCDEIGEIVYIKTDKIKLLKKGLK